MCNVYTYVHIYFNYKLIQFLVQFTETEIVAKFDNLKSTFTKIIKSGKTGDEGKNAKPWPYFNQLMFLKKITVQRPSYTNTQVN